MIYHINRARMKGKCDAGANRGSAGVEAEQESWRDQGRSAPSVKSFIVLSDRPRRL